MRKIIVALAVMLSIGASLPALANSGVDWNTTGTSTYSAEAGGGGR